jgi:Zn-dependent peptidase ImmA (M78 family)
MAIIRKQYFTPPDEQDPRDISLIDTPEKLVRFAELRGLSIIPLDVEGVAREFDIRIGYVSMEEDMSGTLEKDERSNTWSISINKNHHPNRQRYSIAHELGHFCLHKHLSHFFEDNIFFRGGESSSKEEWQANEFASAILMPEQSLREKVRSGTRSIEDLAKEFEVSTLALRIRAKSLGMSGHGL